MAKKIEHIRKTKTITFIPNIKEYFLPLNIRSSIKERFKQSPREASTVNPLQKALASPTHLGNTISGKKHNPIKNSSVLLGKNNKKVLLKNFHCLIPQSSSLLEKSAALNEKKISVPIKKKMWSKEDIDNLLIMVKENVPIKVLSKYFDVTPNAISKTLQRYCKGYSNQIYHATVREKIPQTKINSILQWMIDRAYLFMPICTMEASTLKKTLLVNIILYNNNVRVLSPMEVNRNLIHMKNNTKKFKENTRKKIN